MTDTCSVGPRELTGSGDNSLLFCHPYNVTLSLLIQCYHKNVEHCWSCLPRCQWKHSDIYVQHETSHCEVAPSTSINILRCSPLVPSVCFRFVGRRLASAGQPADPGSSRCDETFPSRAVGLGQSAREESGRLFHNISWLPRLGCFLMQSD